MNENKGKIKEAQEILSDYNIIPMECYDIQIDVEEDQDTFAGNAIKKAETISKMLNGKMCIADDSGIEIEYLDIEKNKLIGVPILSEMSKGRELVKTDNLKSLIFKYKIW